jgi:hypothetical protein
MSVMMASLQSKNKNKRKTPRSSLCAPATGKIVFMDSETRGSDMDGSSARKEDGLNAERPDTLTATSTPAETDLPLMSKTIVPLDKQGNFELPPNVFVTKFHCDEAGVRITKTRTKTSEKSTFRMQPTEDFEARDFPGPHTIGGSIDDHRGVARNGIDVDSIERGWDVYEAVERLEQLRPQSVVGWKVCLCHPSLE